MPPAKRNLASKKTPTGPDRGYCRWALASPELMAYHDREYGFPVSNNRAYFERLVLEIFQAGLSWRTILAKRAAFRRAFAGFSPRRVAAFTAADIERLQQDPAIVRNRRKIAAAVANAGVFVRLSRRPGGFRDFIDSLPLHDRPGTVAAFRRYFVFMGPEIVGEFLMSTGHWPVRHERGCHLHAPPRKPAGILSTRNESL